MIKRDELPTLRLPSIRGRIGDWAYYSTLLSFKEVALRVRQPEEITGESKHESGLGKWIQRDLLSRRIQSIAEYIGTQDQRFFNSIILGIYGGKPSWQDIQLKGNDVYDQSMLTQEEAQYFGRTFGILTLSGNESIFAIDGQHRAMGIRTFQNISKEYSDDEVPVIFIAHSLDDEGVVRTRRLFSTLNRYAVPVNKREIIILSEDNNCSIVTRYIQEEHPLFTKKILLYQTRRMRTDTLHAFTNIIVLNDLVERLVTNKKVYGMKVSGLDYNRATTRRLPEGELNELKAWVVEKFARVIDAIPSYSDLFRENKKISQAIRECNLLFRPIGQEVLFNVLKVGMEHKIEEKVLNYFAKETFTTKHYVWKKVFVDPNTGNIVKDGRARFATLLILEFLGIAIKRSKTDLENLDGFGVSVEDLKKV